MCFYWRRSNGKHENAGLEANNALAARKGVIGRQFVAIVGDDNLEAEVAQSSEDRRGIIGRDIAHIDAAKDRRQSFVQSRKSQNVI